MSLETTPPPKKRDRQKGISQEGSGQSVGFTGCFSYAGENGQNTDNDARKGYKHAPTDRNAAPFSVHHVQTAGQFRYKFVMGGNPSILYSDATVEFFNLGGYHPKLNHYFRMLRV